MANFVHHRVNCIGFWLVRSISEIRESEISPSLHSVNGILSLIYVTLVLGGIPGILIGIPLWALWRRFRERRTLTSATESFSGQRREIAEWLARFKTDTYRLRYVEWLDDVGSKQPAMRRRLEDKNNLWPDMRPPNFDNDAASIKLAQLEEQWMGLDR